MTAITVGTLVAVALCGLVNSVSGCANPQVQRTFDITRYMGKWFDYARFPSRLVDGTRCVTANYTLTADGTVTVLNGAIMEHSLFGLCPWYTSNVAKGEAKPFDDSEPARLGVKFSPYMPAGEYLVLETDYVTYTVVYGCSRQRDGMSTIDENAWILTRERGVAPPDLVNIYQRAKDQGLDISKFELTDQKGCPVWPKE